jgi:predicted nucleic acid-binding protein
VLILDSSGLTKLAERSQRAAALIRALQGEGLWPPAVPTMVLVESIAGNVRTDANVNRFLKACEVESVLPERTARRAGELRARARRGSAVDALVVALAEPGGTVLTSDRVDIEALASRTDTVAVEVV